MMPQEHRPRRKQGVFAPDLAGAESQQCPRCRNLKLCWNKRITDERLLILVKHGMYVKFVAEMRKGKI